jgi:hypothetical protein
VQYHRIPAAGKAWLKRIRWCESRNRYHIAGHHFGAYQFSAATAFAAGFKRLPHLVSPREQDVRAYRWMLKAGASQWACN